MPVHSAFIPSVMGMVSHAHALGTIGHNIANVNTGGFKSTDTKFATVLSDTLFEQSDLGGARPKDRFRIDVQGTLVATDNEQDVAVNGRGFFVLNTRSDGSGDTLYTRDGSFQLTTVDDEAFLVDKNGYFVQGISPLPDGSFPTTIGTPTALRVDPDLFADDSIPTTTGNLNLNLPAAAAIIDDHAAAVSSFDSGIKPAGMEIFNIDVVDSTGTRETVRLNFTKSAINTWQMSHTTSQTQVAQVDTVTLGGTVEAGDVYRVTVNGNIVTYNVTGGEGSIDTIRDALVSAINADVTISESVTAAAGASGELTLTANVAGTSFTATSSATNGGVDVAQVDTVTITSGTIDAGDVYQFAIGADSVTASGATLAALRTNLINAINGDPTLSGLVTAAPGAAAGEITVTSDTAGVPFTATVSVPTDVGTLDASIAIATTTANVTSANDNTATAVTTTANVAPVVTTLPPVTLNFDAKAQLISPTSAVSLSFSFAGGGTASMTLDVSDMTQFAGDFNPVIYQHNGNPASEMISFQFDRLGHVVADFENATDRPIYKLVLATFQSPNRLEVLNGNVFAESQESGEARLTTAGGDGVATFLPNVREVSNVDIADQFTKMIMTQTAYNASATVFRTVDQMTEVARDLKR